MSRKVHQEPMLQACCGISDDAFQLALGVSFYSRTSDLIPGSMRLGDVLQGALEGLFCSASEGVFGLQRFVREKKKKKK